MYIVNDPPPPRPRPLTFHCAISASNSNVRPPPASTYQTVKCQLLFRFVIELSDSIKVVLKSCFSLFWERVSHLISIQRGPAHFRKYQWYQNQNQNFIVIVQSSTTKFVLAAKESGLLFSDNRKRVAVYLLIVVIILSDWKYLPLDDI